MQAGAHRARRSESLDAQGYNTPKNVDELGTYAILKAWAAANPEPSARKRLVMLSSIGVQRRTQMPFPVLNACGVLDAKAARSPGGTMGGSLELERIGTTRAGAIDRARGAGP